MADVQEHQDQQRQWPRPGVIWTIAVSSRQALEGAEHAPVMVCHSTVSLLRVRDQGW